MKISASAIELCFEDDFWDSRDSFFIKGLSVKSRLFAQKMSASAVELASRMIFWVRGSLFSSTVSEPALVYVH